MLCDRIQGSCSIPFIVPKDEFDFDELCYYQSVFQCYLNNKKEFNIRFDRDKNQYYIEVPEDFYISKFPFFSHVRLRINNPFTITSELNFIRYLRNFVLYNELDIDGFPVGSNIYDKDYDLSVRIADDNYIDSKIWKTYDSYLVKNLVEQIPFLFKQLSSFIINEYVEDFYRSYQVVTVKQIEFNQDYFVGHHKSADVLHQLKYFILSSSGVEWINKLSGIGISVYKCESDSSETRFYGDLYNPTLKFNVGKGINFKIYRKTTDTIRFEITFQKQYIKHKFGKQSYDFVYDKLRDIAKSFFKKADFINIIHSAIDNSYSDNFSLYHNLCCFLDEAKPKLMGIADSVLHFNPVSDPELIKYIHSDKDLRGLFLSKIDKYGNKILFFNPVEAKAIRKYNRKILINSDERRLCLSELYKDIKKFDSNARVFVKSDLSGLVWK